MLAGGDGVTRFPDFLELDDLAISILVLMPLLKQDRMFVARTRVVLVWVSSLRVGRKSRILRLLSQIFMGYLISSADDLSTIVYPPGADYFTGIPENVRPDFPAKNQTPHQTLRTPSPMM